jgi:lysyl-tRNA synthetase class 1
MARRKKSADWLADAAEAVEQHVQGRKTSGPLVCASGISPSGDIHLGNLREAMTTHLVAEELIRRGHEVVHLHSWDDFDRLRKVPVGAPEWLADCIGQPLCDIPDPVEGGEYDSYADRYIANFQASCERLGIRARWVRQSEQYRSGAYTLQIKQALDTRLELFDVLARFQTEKMQTVPLEERRANYWPYRVYCPDCGRDTTSGRDWERASATFHYVCACDPGVPRKTCLDEEVLGKLVWKIDWPMRWAFEQVDFEPGGEDHASPGSSYTVGKDIVKHFDWVAPSFIPYGFVGMGGRTKMSSSAGGAATPEFALRFIEPALLRWLYLRRPPLKSFNIDFGAEIWRQYDEWDALDRKVAQGVATPLELKVLDHALRTAAGEVEVPELRVSFRVLFSAADMTSGHRQQILRIVREHLDDAPEQLEAALQPRLDCAAGWVANCLPEDERQFVRPEFAQDVWDGLEAQDHADVALFLSKLDEQWSARGLSDLVYGVSKLQRGMAMDEQSRDPELKAAQRRFFVVLYQLLVAADTGPRLPTLLLSLGRERVRALLGG